MSTIAQPLSSPTTASRLFLGPLLVTAVLHGALMAAYVCAYRGDMSALVCADADRVGEWPYEKIRIGFPAAGFDGQLYYVLARDPWRPYSAAVIHAPALRHVRILYPALAWAMSGGDPVRLLWILPAINLAALVGLAWLGACLAVHFNRSAWWGVLLPIVLNTGMSALRDLTDPLATVALCGLLTAWLLRWPTWQLGAWAIAAILSREQNFLIAAIVCGEALLAHCWSRAASVTAALLLGVGWVVTLRMVYGSWPSTPDNLSPPFAGIWYRWTHLDGLSGAVSKVIHIAGMLLLCAQLLLSVALLYFRAWRLWVVMASAGALLAVVAGIGIYLNGWSYSRVFLWMPLGIWLWSMETGRRWPAFVLSTAALWPLAAVAQAWR